MLTDVSPRGPAIPNVRCRYKLGFNDIWADPTTKGAFCPYKKLSNGSAITIDTLVQELQQAQLGVETAPNYPTLKARGVTVNFAVRGPCAGAWASAGPRSALGHGPLFKAAREPQQHLPFVPPRLLRTGASLLFATCGQLARLPSFPQGGVCPH